MADFYVWHDSFIQVTWLVHVCDATHSYVWNHSIIWMKWLCHICDIFPSYVWHYSFIYVIWLNHNRNMARCYVQGGENAQDAFCCMSLFAKEPLTIGLFNGKRPIKIRNPMSIGHPIPECLAMSHWVERCRVLLSQQWLADLSWDHRVVASGLNQPESHVVVCCSVLQCVAVCCSVLQCVAVCCSVLQCVAVCCSVLQLQAMSHHC